MNVLLIIADALRADRVGCYGYARDTSPHIDLRAYLEQHRNDTWIYVAAPYSTKSGRTEPVPYP